MTATTTTPAPPARPVYRRRSVWTHLLLALAAAAVAIIATIAITDEGGSSPTSAPAEAAEPEVNTAGPAAGMMSADATEQWSRESHRSDITSADAAERRAESAVAADTLTCSSGSTSADAAERCLSDR
jgi:hypothetical protein